MTRRNKIRLQIICATLLGIALLMSLAFYLWQKSVQLEEQRLETFAHQLGQQVENSIIDARDLLINLNKSELLPCSPAHIQMMQESAVSRPFIRAISYWQAADRLCGAGFIQGLEFTPPQASRIYDSGVIAWWPSEETEIGGVELFLMRFGAHSVVIDPRLLLKTGPLEEQKAGLWVEGLFMISSEPQSNLPHPNSLALGLTVDGVNQRILSRFSLGTVFPIDVVAQQPITELWRRYLPTLLVALLAGLLFITLWTFIVLRYSRQRLSLSAELHDAIIKGHLKVKYQPIINLANGYCCGAESLARWVRVSGEEVSPDVFIPIVEEAGLCDELAMAMLRGILNDMSNYLREYPDMKINLNLSARNLSTDTVSDFLEKQLKASGVPARSICLELTERALVDTDDARNRIAELRARGHRIAIDDFGTGYSSLSYLEKFELDILKVDKRFIDAIETDGVISNVITHIIDMANSLKLEVVAEGVELNHQTDWLVSQKVSMGQGYVFSKPLSARQFIEFSRSSPKEDNKIIKFRASGIK